jgi:disulfide bond formation protein DsbB
MNNLDDLKAIWHSAKTEDLPSSKEMMQMVRSFRYQKLRNKWVVIGLSMAFACLIVAVLILTPFKMASTYIGGCMMILSDLWIAFSNIKSLKRFNKLEDCSNLEFLSFIEQTRQNQRYYYKNTMVKVVLLCSIGLAIYLFEPLHQHLLWLTGAYLGILVYFGLLWFVIRPRSYKRNAEKLDAITRHLNSMADQLK